MKPDPTYGEWRSASFSLPRDEHLPVQVRLTGGKVETRKTVSGDWRNVEAWRQIKVSE